MKLNVMSKNFKCVSVALLFFALSVIFCHVSLAEIEWQREYGAMVDGEYATGAYAEGIDNSRPALVDIENDGDSDMFIGKLDGKITFYRNDGTPTAPSWEFVTGNYGSIDVGSYSVPTFCDIDADSDYDMFVGNGSGNIYFYRNDGTASAPIWTLVTNNYESIDVWGIATPVFCDIDSDGLYDMFIGESDGYIHYYRNVGTSSSPAWSFITDRYNFILLSGNAPTFCDIDSDGDFDMFIGEKYGHIYLYRNDGTPFSPSWTLATDDYNSIYVGTRSTPTFRDIDNDSDYDMFIGEENGNITFYRNDGTASSALWALVTERYHPIQIGDNSVPTFCDIDSDGDDDMFVGEWKGAIKFYQNDGALSFHSWTVVSENYDSIDVGYKNVPVFCDIDNDGDYDMFIGEMDGNINFYQNDGTSISPLWTLVTDYYNSINIGSGSAPAFCDIDGDGDYDMFIGESGGNINFYRNDGTATSPSWILVTAYYNSINEGQHIVPTFCDIDDDGDYDLFVGVNSIHFYRNDGTRYSPSWVLVSTNYNSINVGLLNAPYFCDIDNDGDLDLFIGERYGGINFWRNMTIANTYWTLNMAEMPWYKNTAPYYSAGAAICRMILNYIREGAGESLLTQDEIYEYARNPLPYDGTELTSDEIDKALGHFDPYDYLVSNGFDGYDSRPDGNPYQGYNYTVDTYNFDAINEYMRDICHWMAYTVTQENWWDDGALVARPNTPAAIPIYGSYANWVAVKGCVTSENPCPQPHTNPWNTPDFTVYGFWMKDPKVSGIGQNTYKTAAECESTYFLPLVTGDAYDGLFLQVAEPPAEMSNANIEIPKPTTDLANLDFIGVETVTKDSGESSPLMAMSLNVTSVEASKPLIRKQSWRDLVDPHLLTDSEAVLAFENTEMGKPVFIERVVEDSDYYLVPFGKRIKGRFLASAVIILDASEGYFKEASWTDKPEEMLKVNEKKALWLVRRDVTGDFLKELKSLPKKPAKNYLLRQRELLREHNQFLHKMKDADIVLVWEPDGYSSSPYKPYWEIDINGSIWYVTQAEKIIRAD
ncbi:MAG: VCBS repeat-containing protein [Candidatus Omnitrophica bacterium]|nr:VCBS repeat-containing protein [Candidatus Omnitrophota bacterium]